MGSVGSMKTGRVAEWIALFREALGVGAAEARSMIIVLADEGVLKRIRCGVWGIKYQMRSER